MKPQKLCHLNKQNQTLHELNSLKYSMKLSTKKSPTPTINYANQSQSRCMWGVIQLPEYLQTQHTKAQHAKYSKWMVSHTLCNNTHPPTLCVLQSMCATINQNHCMCKMKKKQTTKQVTSTHPQRCCMTLFLTIGWKNTLILNVGGKSLIQRQCWMHLVENHDAYFDYSESY